MKRLILLLIIPFALQLFGCGKCELPPIPEDAVVAKRIDDAQIDAADIPQIFRTEGIEYNTCLLSVSQLRTMEKTF